MSKDDVKMGEEIEMMCKPWNAKIAVNHQKLRGRHGRVSPAELLEGIYLTSLFQTSGLLNCENTFPPFKLPNLWSFVMAALGN